MPLATVLGSPARTAGIQLLVTAGESWREVLRLDRRGRGRLPVEVTAGEGWREVLRRVRSRERLGTVPGGKN